MNKLPDHVTMLLGGIGIQLFQMGETLQAIACEWQADRIPAVIEALEILRQESTALGQKCQQARLALSQLPPLSPG